MITENLHKDLSGIRYSKKDDSTRVKVVYMFIDLNKNNGKDYLRLVNAVRVTNKDGYKVSQKQVTEAENFRREANGKIKNSWIF